MNFLQAFDQWKIKFVCINENRVYFYGDKYKIHSNRDEKC